MGYMYNPHDFSRHPGVTGEHICDIVQRFPDGTIINGTVNANDHGRMSGALYHEKNQMYFLHNDSTYLHGACPPNGVPPPFRFSYFLGGSSVRSIHAFDAHSFHIASISRSSAAPRHIHDYTPQISNGYLMRGSICFDHGGDRISGFLYRTQHPGSKTDGDFYFLHEDSRFKGDKPTEGIPSGVSAYSWSLGEKIRWGCCDPNSFTPYTGLAEHPTTIVMGSYVDHSEASTREERAREMDRERERHRREFEVERIKHTSGGAVFSTMADKTVAVEPPVKEVEKEEPVLFRKHVTKKKSCDVLPMQSAVIIKTSKTNK